MKIFIPMEKKNHLFQKNLIKLTLSSKEPPYRNAGKTIVQRILDVVIRQSKQKF